MPFFTTAKLNSKNLVGRKIIEQRYHNFIN